MTWDAMPVDEGVRIVYPKIDMPSTIEKLVESNIPFEEIQKLKNEGCYYGVPLTRREETNLEIFSYVPGVIYGPIVGVGAFALSLPLLPPTKLSIIPNILIGMALGAATVLSFSSHVSEELREDRFRFYNILREKYSAFVNLPELKTTEVRD